MNQKGFIKDIVIIALGILILGGGYFYFSKKPVYAPSENSNTNQKVADETAGWKIYRNDKYGFEFKYPANTAISDSELLSKENGDFISELGMMVYLDSGIYKSFEEYKKYIKDLEKNNNKNYYSQTLFSEEVINGKQVLFQKGQEVGIAGPIDSYHYIMYVWIGDGKVFFVASYYADENQYQLINKVYHSFRSIK